MRHCLAIALLLCTGLLPLVALADASAEMRIRDLSEQLAENPGNREALVKRALAYVENGRLELARLDLHVAEQSGMLPESKYVRGLIAFRSGDLETAYGYFETALELRPRYRMALEYRARIARDTGREKQALKDYRALINSTPRPGPGTYIATARLMAALPRRGTEEALALLDARVAEIGPVSSLQRCAIQMELERGNTDAALERMGKLAPALRATPEWQVEVAEMQILANRPGEAAPYLEVALQQLESLRITAARQRLKERATALEKQVSQAISECHRDMEPAPECAR